MWVFLVFLAVPLIEIALFIQVGGAIGLWPTLMVVVLTAGAGAYLMRSQGRNALRELQRSFSELRDPAEPLAHGAMILFAGALLLTPGFFTDAFGLSLMVPGVRTIVFRWIRTRINVRGGFSGPIERGSATIEGAYEASDLTRDASDHSSGWTRH
ncbi:MAG: FxsA family protein [Pseudomonadota bacterium]